MSVRYWGMYASQPCRTVVYALRMLKIKYQHFEVMPRRDTRSNWFIENINRRAKTPVVEHNGVKMIESASICRYLWDTFDDYELLLPQKDLVARQKVDALLDINGCFVRPVLMNAYWDAKLSHEIYKAPKASDSQVAKILTKVDTILQDIDSMASNHTYLASDNLSIGDIQIYNEVFNATHHLELELSKYRWLNEWYLRMSQDQIIEDLNKKMIESFEQIRELNKDIPLQSDKETKRSAVEILSSKNAPQAIGPYSLATKVNLGKVSIIYTAGAIGLDPNTNELVSDSLEEQVEHSMKNLVAVLSDNGATLNDVTKANLYLLDMADFGTVNEIYARYFSSHHPARAAVAVKHLPKFCKFEIQAEAVIQN